MIINVSITFNFVHLEINCISKTDINDIFWWMFVYDIFQNIWRKQKWINLLMSLKKICLILIEENDNLKCTRNANHINALFLLVINMTTTIRFLQYQICQAFVKVFVAFLSALSLHSYGWGKIPKYIIERDNDFSISNIANAMPFMLN